MTRELPIHEFYCFGQITARFLRPIRRGEVLFVAVSAGPGLSSRYLDGFLNFLSLRTGANVGVVNYPNHDGSSIPKDLLPLLYPTCTDYFGRALEEINKKSQRVVFLGHQYGARILLDVISREKVFPQAMIALQLPRDYESSEASLKNYKASLLRAVSTGLAPSLLDLFTNLSWDGCESFTVKCPKVEDTLKRIKPNKMPFYFFSSRVSSDGYQEIENVRRVFENTRAIELKSSSGFQILEDPVSIACEIEGLFSVLGYDRPAAKAS